MVSWYDGTADEIVEGGEHSVRSYWTIYDTPRHVPYQNSDLNLVAPALDSYRYNVRVWAML